MTQAKVLVIDDSITMRALFSEVLEQTKDIIVVGTANGAEQAREMIKSERPNVLTLDVEMPGMNGLDFLAEVMENRPMPVVMLSTLTQKGAETSMKAFELGAVDCFPKPQNSNPAEFAKISAKLGKLVLAAANGKVTAPSKSNRRKFDGTYHWDGKLVALSASTGGIEAILEILRTFPANCPPTIALLRIDPGFIAPLVTRLKGEIEADVKQAQDGMKLAQGCVYIAADPLAHVVVDKWPEGCLRFLDKEPVQGFKPSANLLFASMAKTGADTVGAVLTGMGSDGAAGLKALRNAGGATMAQDEATAMVYEAPAAAVAAGAVSQSVALGDIAKALLNASGKTE
ncbi:MAG: chemotaxis response regulator protein-glutamate methylesterase [Sphingomonadales bacterium 17-56-6]|nr:MAG: chemotaxis response regulator protein-glutamate methylesterase [Sphingomonadales bacterium 28-55-16]OYZ89127.1 MAG: chemotaxis response regulator protein-glutamate methylesterase [Sphingomonadales bacterium 17-56-6]